MSMKVRPVYRLALLAAAATLVVVCFGFGARPAAAQVPPIVVPIVDCVVYDPGTDVLTAHFGYTNTGSSTQVIPFSEQNFFTPFPDFRNQPTSFLPGTHHRVFATILNLSQDSELTWHLSEVPATATNDPNLYCNTDVSLAQSAAPEPVLAGERLTYTLTASNNGPVRTAGVTVRNPLPGGVDLVSAEASQGTCSGTDTVACEIGSLGKDQSARVTIVVEPGQPGTLVNTATVSSTQPNRDVSNNTATTRTTVVAPPSAGTGAASDLSPEGATLNATVDPNGSETAYRFEYGTDTTYGQSTPEQPAGAGMDGGLVRADVSGLQPDTTYHYRVVATNAQGTTEGEDKTFATPAPRPEPANTAPGIKILSPEPGSKIRDRTPTIRATIHDAQTDLAKKNIRLWVDGKRVEGFTYDRTRNRLSYTAKKLSHGRHTVLIVACDGKGLSASKFWGFRVVRR